MSVRESCGSPKSWGSSTIHDRAMTGWRPGGADDTGHTLTADKGHRRFPATCDLGAIFADDDCIRENRLL
jgi:hypothetical protein